MHTHLALAVLFAVFIWWFSTGVVLLLNGLQQRTRQVSLGLSSLLGLAALYALWHTSGQTSVAARYCAFTSALLVWGWHELSFLSGWITGSRRTPIADTLVGWPRFVQAVRAILWHELAIVVVGVLILFITWHAPNRVGVDTFLVLWVMRTSAKLNLFLGVRNLSEAFLPPPLAYLQSFFRRRPMNALLPFSVVAAGGVLAAIVWQALHPATDSAQSIGLVLVGTLLALAIVEHLLLVLPVDTTALWHWALGQRRPSPVRTA
jgi:putative photosynthetic complex assembly protein 2